MRNPASGRQAPPPPPPPETPIANRQMPEDTLLTTSQAAAILRVSTETLKKWRQRPGRGPEFIRYPGGSVRYRLSAILKFLADCTVQP
jgi:hypothetical protein